ncbi:MAG: sulfotransferase domain-containing protein [Deltaproteobacteria bacterium]
MIEETVIIETKQGFNTRDRDKTKFEPSEAIQKGDTATMGKKVLIAGYPKSGNTWLGYMLAYILGAKYIDLHAPKSKPTWQEGILALIEGNLSHNSDYSTVCKTHSQLSDVPDLWSYHKVIHLVRDPRDIAVSLYFFRYYNLPIAQGKPEAVLSRKNWLIRQLFWKVNILRVARQWPLHTLSWQSFIVRLAKYEDMHAHCSSVIKGLCDYLEHRYNSAILQNTVDLFSFERLSGGRSPGVERQSSFFRKGVVGDYKNRFGSLDITIMKKYAQREMLSVGYSF